MGGAERKYRGYCVRDNVGEVKSLSLLSILASVVIAWYVLRYGSHMDLWRALDETRKRTHYLIESVRE